MSDDTEREPDTLPLPEILAQKVSLTDVVQVWRFESRYMDETAYGVAQVLLGSDGSASLMHVETGRINGMPVPEKGDLDVITAFLGINLRECFHRCPEREEEYRQQIQTKQSLAKAQTAADMAQLTNAMKAAERWQKGKIH